MKQPRTRRGTYKRRKRLGMWRKHTLLCYTALVLSIMGTLALGTNIEPAAATYDSGHEWEEREVRLEVKVEWNEEKIREHVASVFPEETETALAVVKCESNFNPEAVNTANKDGSIDRGLWQINSVHDFNDHFDIVESTKFARQLYDQYGFKPWVCFTKGLI